MAAQPPSPGLVSPASPPGRAIRVEYLGFQGVDEYRVFRFRVYGAEGSSEFRIRIANAAFDAHRIRMQDGPDLCYQRLRQAIAAGVTAQPDDVITIADADLSSYRDDHVVVPKRRPRPPSSPVEPSVAEPRRQTPYRPRTPRAVTPQLPTPPPDETDAVPAFEEGQRVNHAVFGMGVTSATTSARTVVTFDQDGPKSFVTSMLELEVLSPPHTWETGPRGRNRASKTVGGTTTDSSS